MHPQHQTWLTWMLALGTQRRHLDRLAGSARGGASANAVGLALLDEATTLQALIAVTADAVREQRRYIRDCEDRCAWLSEAWRNHRPVPTGRPEGLLREAIRRGLPYAWREAVMDWVRRPYVGAPLSRLGRPTREELDDLVARLDALEVEASARADDARAVGAALRLPPTASFRARRAEALARVEPLVRALSHLAARGAGQLAARLRQIDRVAAYRDNLDYVLARIDPSRANPCRRPSPLPDLPPDRLRLLTRRVVPDPLRHAVRDWALP